MLLFQSFMRSRKTCWGDLSNKGKYENDHLGEEDKKWK